MAEPSAASSSVSAMDTSDSKQPALVTLPSTPLLNRFRQQRDELISSNSLYELLQHYKAAVYRLSIKKDYSTAALLALDGASLLLQHGQSNAGGEMGQLLVACYTKAAVTASATALAGSSLTPLASILHLFWSFPPDAATSRLAFMRSAVQWSVSEQFKFGHPDVHLALARYHTQPQPPTQFVDFSQSNKHFLLSLHASHAHATQYGNHILRTLPITPQPTPTTPAHPVTAAEHDTLSEHVAVLTWWIGCCDASEAGLLLVRAALQYMAMGEVASGAAVLNGCTERLSEVGESKDEWIQTPLLHFAHFMIRVCEIGGTDGGVLLDMLRQRYARCWARDAVTFNAYLDRIGQVYCGREATKSFLDSLLSA